ncbi:serine/threonine-protein kinase [Nonomuraea glycinis]|uniref:serine/threonine-protein kinase n=1 Tax=Nonomuraea glycinis TaxID=2047744 RepID=UPI002E0DD248|nr:serine/threonine protein kinase [Nonomuraea glycinis]
MLGGRYRLRAKLGSGGMGTVWRAHDELLDREVAVKELTVSGPQHEEQIARTMREARIAARLTHPNIAAVYDVVLADERPWIIMQYVPSSSLATVIANRGTLPVATVTRIGLEVLAALRAAHAAGVLHRDVKPANILLTGEGSAILTDFGLATTLDDERPQANVVMGTAAYIAPERARGAPATARSDLWSLGATLYAAVEGRTPFAQGSEQATLSAVVTSSPAPFDQAGELAPVISGLLEKDPDERTGSARVQEQLERVAALFEPKPAAAAPSTETRAPARPLGVRWRAVRRKVAVHGREAAAMAALIVCVVTTSGHSEPTHHPAAIIPPSAMETPSDAARAAKSGILYVQRMSHKRTKSPSSRRTQDPDQPQATATKSSRSWVPPGQAKKKRIPPGQAKKQVPPGQAKKQGTAGKAKGRHKG